MARSDSLLREFDLCAIHHSIIERTSLLLQVRISRGGWELFFELLQVTANVFCLRAEYIYIFFSLMLSFTEHSNFDIPLHTAIRSQTWLLVVQALKTCFDFNPTLCR